MSTSASTAASQGFCGTCYKEAINRLCATLPPHLAVRVRQASREILEARSQDDTLRHPGHREKP